MPKTHKNGFTLLEVLITVFLLTVGIVGIFAIIPQLMASVSFSSSQLTANYLVQEGIEIIRNIRDGNWLEYRADPANPWDEGLALCVNGCEIDYTILGLEDPALNPWQDRYLYIDGTNGFYRYISSPSVNDIKTQFKRKITTTAISGNSYRVTVEVFWEERGNSYQVTAIGDLYNWK